MDMSQGDLNRMILKLMKDTPLPLFANARWRSIAWNIAAYNNVFRISSRCVPYFAHTYGNSGLQVGNAISHYTRIVAVNLKLGCPKSSYSLELGDGRSCHCGTLHVNFNQPLGANEFPWTQFLEECGLDHLFRSQRIALRNGGAADSLEFYIWSKSGPAIWEENHTA